MDTLSRRTLCPVCGFNLGFPAWDGDSPSDEICPSCGIQFGYDDAASGDEAKRRLIYQQWRQKWITEKMPWHSVGRSRPASWDPVAQLRQIGIILPATE
jgi:hypothetical protein